MLKAGCATVARVLPTAARDPCNPESGGLLRYHACARSLPGVPSPDRLVSAGEGRSKSLGCLVSGALGSLNHCRCKSRSSSCGSQLAPVFAIACGSSTYMYMHFRAAANLARKSVCCNAMAAPRVNGVLGLLALRSNGAAPSGSSTGRCAICCFRRPTEPPLPCPHPQQIVLLGADRQSSSNHRQH